MVSKKKSSNPLDAHRKAARARELKKNREKREETREVTLVKKDTRGLEKDIRALQDKNARSNAEQEELSRLQSELKRIKDAKEEYLVKNPEHRKFVYPRESEEQAEQAERDKAAQDALKRQQPQRDPRRSIYYHEIFNPHGAAPPGMPYMEKTAEQWEVEQKKEFDNKIGDGSSDEEEEESANESEEEDDDIVLPDGPPPLPPAEERSYSQKNDEGEDDSSEDEDGIVMPKGPPPGLPTAPRAMQDGLPLGPSAMLQRPPPLPRSFSRPPPLPIPMPLLSGQSMYRPPVLQQPPVSRTTWSAPPRPNPPPASLPGPPPPPPAAVITSAPVLRDLKKEATAFIPPALRKKQAALKAKASKGGLPSAVNAAPRSVEEEDQRGEQLEERTNLLSSLQSHFTH